jgi:preprotein translocase subunit SecD
VYLYALKLETGKRAVLKGHDIDSIRCIQEKTSKYWYIDFSFKKSAIKLWSTITRQNIGNAIAITVDNHVICAPVINSVIEGGKCSVTGNFTEADVKQFASFVHYGELPAGFQVVK